MLREKADELRTERDRARADADAQREMLKAALDDMRNRRSLWSRLFRS
jgi:siroheme synthase (precorrin-2 oxidase/ferrochelatase)